MIHIQLIDIGLQLSYYRHMPNRETARKRTLLHESNMPAGTNKEYNAQKDTPPIAAMLAKCSIDATELSSLGVVPGKWSDDRGRGPGAAGSRRRGALHWRHTPPERRATSDATV